MKDRGSFLRMKGVRTKVSIKFVKNWEFEIPFKWAGNLV